MDLHKVIYSLSTVRPLNFMSLVQPIPFFVPHIILCAESFALFLSYLHGSEHNAKEALNLLNFLSYLYGSELDVEFTSGMTLF